MQKLEPITIINVDNVPHAVSDMSDTVKRLVQIYNEWRDDEEETKSELLKVQAAMRDLSREIVVTIKKEKEDAAADQRKADEAVAFAKAETEAANESEVVDADPIDA